MDVNKMEEEIENLSHEEELFDLESLITDGKDAKIPIEITFPKPDGTGEVKATAMIRPLTNIEVNNATRLGLNKNIDTTYELELLKTGLYTSKGEPFPDELINKIPSGVVNELAREISRVSGIQINNEENMRLAKEMMGF